MHDDSRRAMRSLASFDVIDQLKNMSGSVTFPPDLEQAYANGSLSQTQYETYQEMYKTLNQSAEDAIRNAEAAQTYIKSNTTDVPPSGNPLESTSSTGLNTTSLIEIILGAVAAVVVLVALFLYVKRRRNAAQRRRYKGDNKTVRSSTGYSSISPHSHTGDSYGPLDDANAPWKDEALLAVRVPLDTIQRGALVSRGGFGEVYRGTFRGRDVAIKTLLPEKRKDVKQIKGFWAEIKFMSTLDHPRIVEFIGVAWESLSDLCVVTEFMDGGDLWSLLSSFDEATPPRPRGFDSDKIQIALHVVHALTYLHSLQPIVLHRDLKSRNILLDEAWNAKLTDFGVSRERIDATMTAGVGSSLWMAPEVMMGERYDEKADMFSFGVVLSELDTQQLPYADACEEGTGRLIPQTAVLQLVSLGRLAIALTESPYFVEMQKLARDCVAMSPADRPTAAEALHRVHVVWRNIAYQEGFI